MRMISLSSLFPSPGWPISLFVLKAGNEKNMRMKDDLKQESQHRAQVGLVPTERAQ